MDTIINSDSQFIKYTTRKGEYLVNKNKSIKTKLYDHIYSYRNGYLLQKDSLFGLMDLFGNEIVSPQYKKSIKTDKYPRPFVPDSAYPYLICDYEGKEIVIYPNGKYEGVISLEYDGCRRIPFLDYYIVRKNCKYGIVSKWDNKIILPTLYFSIKSYEENMCPSTNNLVVVQDENGFFLFSLQKKDRLTNHYDDIEFIQAKRNICINRRNCCFYIGEKFCRKYILSSVGKLVTDISYDEVILFWSRFLKVRNREKWGLINRQGELLLPIDYDSIESICNDIVNVVKGGQRMQIKVDRSKLLYNDTLPINTWEASSYGKYSGSYAQDEMGWSDDDIDTVLDGNPDAYWNID